MSLKRTITRTQVKAYRKIFGKGKKDIVVDTTKGRGLTESEIKSILSIIWKAINKKELPKLTYEYRSPIKWMSKEPLYLKPKSRQVAIGSLAVKVKRVIQRELGSKYTASAI